MCLSLNKRYTGFPPLEGADLEGLEETLDLLADPRMMRRTGRLTPN